MNALRAVNVVDRVSDFYHKFVHNYTKLYVDLHKIYSY